MFEKESNDLEIDSFQLILVVCICLINYYLSSRVQVPRLLKVTSQESPYFEIISPLNSMHKVGAGLAITYKVLFTPDDRKVTLH